MVKDAGISKKERGERTGTKRNDSGDGDGENRSSKGNKCGTEIYAGYMGCHTGSVAEALQMSGKYRR